MGLFSAQFEYDVIFFFGASSGSDSRTTCRHFPRNGMGLVFICVLIGFFFCPARGPRASSFLFHVFLFSFLLFPFFFFFFLFFSLFFFYLHVCSGQWCEPKNSPRSSCDWRPRIAITISNHLKHMGASSQKALGSARSAASLPPRARALSDTRSVFFFEAST